MRPRWHADLGAVVGERDARVGARVVQLAQHRVETCGRRRPAALAGAGTSAAGCARDAAAARPARRDPSVPPSSIAPASCRGELVEQERGLGLVAGRRARASRDSRETPRRARRDVVAQRVAPVPRIGVAFVVDPASARAFAYASIARAAGRAAAAAAPGAGREARDAASPRARADRRRAAAAAAASPPGRPRDARARRRRPRAPRAPRSAPRALRPRGSARAALATSTRCSDQRHAARGAARRRTRPSASAFARQAVMDVRRDNAQLALAAPARAARRAATIESRRRTARRRRGRRRAVRRERRATASMTAATGTSAVRHPRVGARPSLRCRRLAAHEGVVSGVRVAPGAAATSAGVQFLELAIGEDLVLARLEQRVERLLLQLAQRLGQRLLQRRPSSPRDRGARRRAAR